ncbi:MAG: glycoside hydrolase family 15 protein [Acidimicrobiales bacterium]
MTRLDRSLVESETPISQYGLLGDTRTAALVSSDGSVDWLCLPRFDGEPVFGRLVGGSDAGRFRIAPVAEGPVVGRRYRPETATVETTWATAGGAVTLADGMIAEPGRRLLPSTLLVRHITAEGGPVDVRVEFDPRLGRNHRRPRTRRERHGVVCDWGSLALSLGTSSGVAVPVGEAVDITIEPERPLTFALGVAYQEPLVHVEPAAAYAALLDDERRWQRWCAEVGAGVAHRDAVVRSLLTLRLLTYSPSGAPVAAPTTSLPEAIGGERNWDYRYAWPRDASIGVAAMIRVGKLDDARRFLAWLLHASRLDRPRLPVLLTLDGRRAPGERELGDWPGYQHSRPVRVGNGAADQHQLDVYGWVIDSAWNLTAAGHRLNSETWRAVRAFADYVCRRWSDPDAGIWEVRSEPQHYVHSKLMAWLALDRALRIGETYPLSRRRRQRWQRERRALGTDIRGRGFDPARNTYTRTYGSAGLDAALLVLPFIGLEPTGSPRVAGTIHAIRGELSAGGPLLYRYPRTDDGLPGKEGAFLPCSFWLAQALAAEGRRDEAEDVFAATTGFANPLGLYPEEIDPATGSHLGNYPQALTHTALVQAALALGRP